MCLKKNLNKLKKSRRMQVSLRKNTNELFSGLSGEDLDRELELKGRQAAIEYPRLAKFGLALSHPEFAKFFESNFETWEDCKQSIMLIKSGMILKEAIQKSTGDLVSGNQITAALQAAIDNQETRQFMVKSLLAFMKQDDSKDIKNIQKISEIPEVSDPSGLLKML